MKSAGYIFAGLVIVTALAVRLSRKSSDGTPPSSVAWQGSVSSELTEGRHLQFQRGSYGYETIPAQLGLSEDVSTVLRKGLFDQRYSALEKLDRELSAADCHGLLAYLKTPMTERELNVEAGIKNEVLNILRHQPGLPAPWHKLLIEIFEDKSQHPVMRDYALQHLFVWHDEVLKIEGGEATANETRQAMWKALEEAHTPIPGTALLGLCNLIGRDPVIDRERVAAEAIAKVASDTSLTTVRMTALQVCARMELAEAVPTARNLCASPVSLPMRLSAIAALGMLGREEELTLLEELKRNHAEGAVKVAVSAAIENLINRIKG